MKAPGTFLLILMMFLPPVIHAETGVSRSVFTSAIKNKEPVSKLGNIPTNITRVYFFTELLGLKGHTIKHRWEYNGQVLAEVSFEIAADRWRTWSSKNMLASWTGKWQVSVLDEGGNIIEQSNFEYVVPVENPGPDVSQSEVQSALKQSQDMNQ